MSYYLLVCESVGLNPLTKPFEYVVTEGKLKLYATRACSDQLSMMHGLSCKITNQGMSAGDLYTVSATASSDNPRRETDDLSAIHIKSLQGEKLANGIKKCVTQAKRRAILSHCGLGIMDETEVEDAGGTRLGVDQMHALEQRHTGGAPPPAAGAQPALTHQPGQQVDFSAGQSGQKEPVTIDHNPAQGGDVSRGTATPPTDQTPPAGTTTGPTQGPSPGSLNLPADAGQRDYLFDPTPAAIKGIEAGRWLPWKQWACEVLPTLSAADRQRFAECYEPEMSAVEKFGGTHWMKVQEAMRAPQRSQD